MVFLSSLWTVYIDYLISLFYNKIIREEKNKYLRYQCFSANKKERGSPFSINCKKTTGMISASNGHFGPGDWGDFQEKHLFSQVELSKPL